MSSSGTAGDSVRPAAEAPLHLGDLRPEPAAGRTGGASAELLVVADVDGEPARTVQPPLDPAATRRCRATSAAAGLRAAPSRRRWRTGRRRSATAWPTVVSVPVGARVPTVLTPPGGPAAARRSARRRRRGRAAPHRRRRGRTAGARGRSRRRPTGRPVRPITRPMAPLRVNSAAAADRRMQPHPHALHAEQPAAARLADDLAALDGVEGEDLLDEHRLPGAQRQECGVVVLGVGGRHVDDVDVGIGDQVGVAAVRARSIEAAGERGGAVGVARADGVHGAAVGTGQVGAEGRRDRTRAEDAPAQRADRAPWTTRRRTARTAARSRAACPARCRRPTRSGPGRRRCCRT